MEKIKRKYVVFEYNTSATSNYIGCRFISNWTEPITQKEDNVDIIAENLSKEDAQILIGVKPNINTGTSLDDLPDKLQSSKTDTLKNLLNDK